MSNLPRHWSLWVHAMTVLIAVAILFAILAVLLVRARFLPYGPCPACRGRSGRGWGSTEKAYSRCRRCKGTRERIRPLSRIYPRWREEARKR